MGYLGYAENWPESYQPVNCLTFSLQLFFGPRNRRSSSSSRRKDKKQKAQKRKGKCRARATKTGKEREEGKPCKYAEAEFLVETEDSNDSQKERERGRGRAGQTGMGANGVGHKVFYFSSFALSNLNDKWRRHRLQTTEGTGKRVQHASACPATLTLALTFCCLSREHVITLSRVQTAREKEKTREMREKNKDNAYRGSWQTLPSNLDRHLSSPVPHSPSFASSVYCN